MVGRLGIYLAVVQLTYMLDLLSHIFFLFHFTLGTFSFWQASTQILRARDPALYVQVKTVLVMLS